VATFRCKAIGFNADGAEVRDSSFINLRSSFVHRARRAFVVNQSG
jgi:hypothetical protein